jgi:hypothetical protein
MLPPVENDAESEASELQLRERRDREEKKRGEQRLRSWAQGSGSYVCPHTRHHGISGRVGIEDLIQRDRN